MSPQVAAGLTAFVGICLIAGWITGFRNRAYVGWLGLAFLALAGFLLALGKHKEAQETGAADPRLATAVKVLLFVWVAAFLVSMVAAVRETSRRLKELRASHEAAEEGLLEIMRGRQEHETRPGPAGAEDEGEGSSGEDKT
jgi:hypothetical protein